MLLRAPRGHLLTSRLPSTWRRMPLRPLLRTSLSITYDCGPANVEPRFHQSPSSLLLRTIVMSSTFIQPPFAEIPSPLLLMVERRTVTPAVSCVPTWMPDAWLLLNVESSTVTLVPEPVAVSAP